jgi:hypothetical protein
MQHLVITGSDRVRDHSSVVVNRRIDCATEGRLQEYAMAGREQLGRRLAELDREWDVDRAIIATFSVLGGLTLSLGMRRAGPRRKGNGWMYLFATQLGFLMMHALVGWCPPTAVLRRLGFRTSKEIQAEREILQELAQQREPARSEREARYTEPGDF